MIATLQRLLLGSLRRQMVTGMVLTVALMMSAFVWDLTQRQQQVVLEQQSRQAVGIARSVAVTGSIWLASRDVSGLQEIVLGLSNYPDLRYAMVLDTQGQVLAHTEPMRRGQYLTDLPATAELQVLQRGAHLVDVFSPVLLNARPIGWVRVGLAGTAVSAVESGQSGLRVEVSGTDEAAQLARQFNTMLDALAQRDRALKDSESFKTVILDSVAAEIAVIDSNGVIVAVNEQWRRFALDNSILPGQPAPQTGVGANYLNACQSGDDLASVGAALARDGIRAVLGGARLISAWITPAIRQTSSVGSAWSCGPWARTFAAAWPSPTPTSAPSSWPNATSSFAARCWS
jgi:PAS domain-containing protein